ncbi:hypothetical protein [Leptolyngbya iicbica]|nr:hypothetical protein [Leptolyngbya sp. LK]
MCGLWLRPLVNKDGQAMGAIAATVKGIMPKCDPALTGGAIAPHESKP